MGDEASVSWVFDNATRDWVDLAHGTTGLAPGLAGGRYVCWACREHLMLKGARPDSKVSPYFSHTSGADCAAAPAVREQLEADGRIVIEFQRRITRAWPGVHCVLEAPFDAGANAAAGRSVLPPAVVVGGDGNEVLVVERPRRPVGTGEVEQRIQAVKARYGGGARHVWFWAKDALQAARLADLAVLPRGLAKARHATIAPTEQQLAILAAGGRVYFLDGQQVLIPYGVHDFDHEQRSEEDWDFPDWRWGWHRDWRISHPVPAPDATRWGLAPVTFDELTRTRGVFSLATANDLMNRLEQSQRGRWRSRRSQAAALYQERHRPTPPAEPTAPLPMPAAEASPEPPAPPAAPPEPPASAAAVPGSRPHRPPLPEERPEPEAQKTNQPDGEQLPEDSVYLPAAAVPPGPMPPPPAYPPAPGQPPLVPSPAQGQRRGWRSLFGLRT
ncbi:hypothetical protein [Kitasatospora phosalacinea]|uniref:hypothetical protein n=1 Tax=Kitasatospora phosalacinea TaxID=2065 RepID=UPI00131D748F|nr:hypothetical protein [Kitasatospora phosalacinea]